MERGGKMSAPSALGLLLTRLFRVIDVIIVFVSQMECFAVNYSKGRN